MCGEKAKGSTTVFFALTILMVLSLIFSMSEVTRYLALSNTASGVSDVVIESAFAEYNRILWDDYGILGIDASFGSGEFSSGYFEQKMMNRMDANCNANEGKESNFLRMTAAGCGVTKYGLLTDDEGAAFRKEAAKAALVQIPKNVLMKNVSKDKELQNNTEEEQDIEQLIQNGKDALEQIKAGEEEVPEVSQDGSKVLGATDDNPMNTVSSLQNKGILGQVLPGEAALSEETISLGGTVTNRILNQGNAGEKVSVSALEELLFLEYVMENFGSYTKKGKGRMQYELEYILCGKESDQENLKGAVSRLLLLRETENLIVLHQDSARVAEALSLATAIAGSSANPALVELVKEGILASWAYAESVLDVRCLLKGGKISMLKTPAEWTSDLYALGTYVDPHIVARECEEGMNYEGFLKSIFLLESKKTMGLRALDLLETTIRARDEYAMFQMDFVIYRAQCEYIFEASPLFCMFIFLPVSKLNSYDFKETRELNYLL